MQQKFVLKYSFRRAAKMKTNIKTFSTAEELCAKAVVAVALYKIGVLKKFPKIHRKASVENSPFNKVKAYNFIKKIIQHMCSPVNFAKFLRIHFLKNTSGRLLLRRTYF